MRLFADDSSISIPVKDVDQTHEKLENRNGLGTSVENGI